MILSGVGGNTTRTPASTTLFKLGDRAVLVDPTVDQRYRNRPGVVVELYTLTMRIKFDDNCVVSPCYYFHLFEPPEPSFTVKVDFTTKNFDEAVNLASTLARAGGHAVGVVNADA